MEKQKSLKLEKWSTADIIKNVICCLVNVIVIFGIYVGVVYFNCKKPEAMKNFEEYFSNLKNAFHFLMIDVTVVVSFDLYFLFEDSNYIRVAKNAELMLAVIVFSLIANYLIGYYVHYYLRPLALTAMLVLFLSSKKKAIFAQIASSILLLTIDWLGSVNGQSPFEFYLTFIIGIISGMIAVFIYEDVYSRVTLVLKSFFVSLPSLLYLLFNAETIWLSGDIIFDIIAMLLSGPIAACAFIVTVPFFELFFSKITYFKLAEITDHKAKIISRLIEEAPGTFNHSTIVSNLAEACALAIGEDALFARTCAYYHDVGKLRRPEYFVENQTDDKNMHDDLSPELSANIIKAHAMDGYKLVIKAGLPKEIADVCVEHHGTLPIVYFYEKAKKFTDGEVNIKNYCYEGPRPQSKISAIIMIADGCEAATRTLTDRSRENVEKIVKSIIDYRRNLGQFDECDITLNELSIIEQTLVNNFSGIYHSRVAYPVVKKKTSKKKKLK